MRTDFTRIPQLSTRHLLLRSLEEGDAHAVFRLRSDPSVMRFIPKPLNTRVEQSLRMIQDFRQAAAQGDSIMWGILVKGSPNVVGYIGFWRLVKEEDRAEIGYALHPDLWGQGLMTEALQATLEFGFRDLGLRVVEAQVTPDNTASVHVLNSNGFRLRQSSNAGAGEDGSALVFERFALGGSYLVTGT